ncbi:brain-enriched guanylate kinase-associated protein-like isoform X2 [Acropora palmata]
MAVPSEKCGLTPTCELLRSEDQELWDKMQMPVKAISINSEEKIDKSLTSSTEEQEIDVFVKLTKTDLLSTQEYIKRLKADYDEMVKKNQELESKLLQMGEELEKEKSCFEETVGNMSEQLMEFVEKMNKMEKESMKNKRDCSLVVQLLKCNQSLDTKFVSQKVQTLPTDLKEKLSVELDISTEPKPLNHPAWSRKRWRTKSASLAASTSCQSELSDVK